MLESLENVDIRALRVFNAAPSVGNPSGFQGATGYSVNVYEHVTNRAYDVKFPELYWQITLPAGALDTSVPAGADTASYTAKDRRGKGAFRAVSGKDIPTVGFSIGKIEIPIEEGAVMAQVDLHEIEKIQMGHGMSAVTEYGEIMRLSSERQIEDVFFFGYANLNFAGYLDYPFTPVIPAALKADPGTTTVWADATNQEIADDINTLLSTVYVNSRGAHRADRLELPVDQFLQIANTPWFLAAGVATSESVLEYIKRKNSTTALTQVPIDIRPLIYLKGAGVSGVNRAIATDTRPENHYMPMSVPFSVLPPQNVAYAINFFARWRWGSYHKPYPAATTYMDGI